ncbi:MAG: hypothetical protein HWD92_09325 [Flavobacteriia bacterium]|nr:hypothetical protein [Flavobacteriia bacterium]
MKPLIVLLVVFVLCLLIRRFKKERLMLSFAGRLAMTFMMIFSAVGHFVFTDGMAMMMPDFIPYREGVVYFSGVLEIGFALGLLINRLNLVASWTLIVFFILVLPANIYASIHHIDLQTATDSGYGIEYLWFRVPLQVVFITWVYIFGIFLPKKESKLG